MEGTNLEGLHKTLTDTLSPDATVRKNAEKIVQNLQKTKGYAPLLLELLTRCNESKDITIAQASAILFKNFIKENWDRENADSTLSEEDRTWIKEALVNLLCALPDTLQRQLSTALITIGESDFPSKWNDLLVRLIQMLETSSSWNLRYGIFLATSTLFKRFRNVYKSDELYKELKFCLETFQKPLMHYYQTAIESLKTTNDKAILTSIIECMHVMNRIFYSLNWQDLPEFFEDNITTFMSFFSFALDYDNPLLQDESEEEVAGPLDYLHASTVDNINLYEEKYAEEFKPFLENFLQQIWMTLSSRITIHPKHDILAAACMKFVKNVCTQEDNQQLFQNEKLLCEIIENVIIKNLRLRQADEDLFEDNALEFIRRAVDGSEADTRRSAARELLRNLLSVSQFRTIAFRETVTKICLSNVSNLLATYTQNPEEHWKLKDMCYGLLSAVAIIRRSSREGVSQVNESVPLMDFITNQVITELTKPISQHKILQVNAIRFIATFRNQLPPNIATSMFQILKELLIPQEFVVHTCAASCIEKLLSVRPLRHTSDGISAPSTTITPVDRQQVLPLLPGILENIFGIINQPGYPENEYIMKTLMRIFIYAKSDILSVADLALKMMSDILQRIAVGPSNPTFCHYLFESISILVDIVCRKNPSASQAIEEMLFPTFQSILAADVDVLCPYVYQVLAQILELRPQHAAGPYAAFLPTLLIPTLWEKTGNITGMVKLLEVYLDKETELSCTYEEAILGVFQKLLSRRTTETMAFDLLRAVFARMPRNVYEKHEKEIVKILMMRLQTRMGGKNSLPFITELIYTLSLFIAKYGLAPLWQATESLQKGMFAMFLNQVWAPNTLRINGRIERKACAAGHIRLVSELPSVESDDRLWCRVLDCTIKLIEETDPILHNKTQEDILEDLEETGYDAGFSRLYFASYTSKDYLPDAPSPRTYLPTCLAKLSSIRPGHYNQVAQANLPEDSYEALIRAFQETGISFA